MDLKSLYEWYKESTKYPLTWLWSQGCPASSQPQTWFKSTSEIIRSARSVKQKGIIVPSSVISKLSDAIKKRRDVLKIYRSFTNSSNEGNAKHEAFVNRLEQVLRILLPLKAKALPGGINPVIENKSEPSGGNPFASLSTVGEGALEEDHIQNNAKVNPDTTNIPVMPPADAVLEDDEFAQWIELSLFIYEMDTILEFVNRYWEDAAKEKMPIALVAALSTFAMYAVDRIATRYAQLAAHATVFIDKWMVLKTNNPKIRFRDMPALACQFGGRLDDQLAFHHVHLLIHHMRTADEYRTLLPNAGNPSSASDLIQRTRPHVTSDTAYNDESFDRDDVAFDEMQESMRQLLQTDRAIAALEPALDDRYNCEPLLPFMRRITADNTSPIPVCLVFSMEMLLSSFKAFMWPDYTLNKTNCRVKVLKFAQDVFKEVNTTLKAIEAHPTTGENLLLLQTLLLQARATALEQVIKEKRFDLYYQAPWTAGSHMSEILDVARFDGADLCFQSQYLCALLHLYNALRAIPQSIASITLLERLCSAYKGPIFLGTPPTENFSSHYRRARGKTFGRDKESGKVDYSKLPSTSQEARNRPSMHLCLFTELHGNCYQTDVDFWMQIYRPDSAARSTRSQKDAMLKELHSVSFNVALEKTKQRLLRDFQGDLPLARLNLLAVFRFCLKLLSDLGAAIREHVGTTGNPTDLSLGFEYVDNLLEGIVQHLRDDQRSDLMKYWRQLNVAKDVFAKIGGDLKCEDFLWKL